MTKESYKGAAGRGGSYHTPKRLFLSMAEAAGITVKVGMVGDAQVGKTSLMYRYVDGSFDEDYIQTLGVNFMEKQIMVKKNLVTFSIWDLGGVNEFLNMMPLLCNDAAIILFMFDLTRKMTLLSVRDWYRNVRQHNKTARPILVGTKYDLFSQQPFEYQQEIVTLARKYAKPMKAPLVFSSASESINVNSLFKIVLARAFGLRVNLQLATQVGEPILEGFEHSS